MSGSMRAKMPECAAWLDQMRQAFGESEVTGWIRDGIAHGRFYAAENGHEIGKPDDRVGVVPFLPAEKRNTTVERK